MKLWIEKISFFILLITNYPDIFIKRITITIKQFSQKSSRKLNNSDLSDINDLLNVNLNFIESVRIIENKKNSYLITEIINRCEKGENQTIVLADYLKNDVKNYFNVFIQYLSFSQSISLALEIKEIRESLLKDIYSELLYPLILLFISLVGMLLFSSFGFKSIINILGTFEYNFLNLIIINSVIKVIVYLIFLILFLIIIILLYSNVSNNKTLIYVIICNIFKSNFYQEYISNIFIRYFNECVKLGLKTKESLQLLSNMNNPLIKLECYHLDKSLRNGETIITAIDNNYLDDKLSRFFKIAMYSDDLNSILNKYIIFSNNRFKRICKKYSIGILIFCYCFISLIIIFIYQILFVPLTIMSEI